MSQPHRNSLTGQSFLVEEDTSVIWSMLHSRRSKILSLLCKQLSFLLNGKVISYIEQHLEAQLPKRICTPNANLHHTHSPTHPQKPLDPGPFKLTPKHTQYLFIEPLPMSPPPSIHSHNIRRRILLNFIAKKLSSHPLFARRFLKLFNLQFQILS